MSVVHADVNSTRHEPLIEMYSMICEWLLFSMCVFGLTVFVGTIEGAGSSDRQPLWAWSNTFNSKSHISDKTHTSVLSARLDGFFIGFSVMFSNHPRRHSNAANQSCETTARLNFLPCNHVVPLSLRNRNETNCVFPRLTRLVGERCERCETYDLIWRNGGLILRKNM